jgi:hypothetical protein
MSSPARVGFLGGAYSTVVVWLDSALVDIYESGDGIRGREVQRLTWHGPSG